MDILHSWMQHSHKKFKDETLDFNEFDGFSPEVAPSYMLRPPEIQPSLFQSLPTVLLIWTTEQREWLEWLFPQFSSRLYLSSATVGVLEKLVSHTQQVPDDIRLSFSWALVRAAPLTAEILLYGKLGEHWAVKTHGSKGSNLHFRHINHVRTKVISKQEAADSRESRLQDPPYPS